MFPAQAGKLHVSRYCTRHSRSSYDSEQTHDSLNKEVMHKMESKLHEIGKEVTTFSKKATDDNLLGLSQLSDGKEVKTSES